MLQDRFESDKLFTDILRLTNTMDPVLAQIDQLLDDEELYQLIRQDLAQRYPQTKQTGRNSTPVEVLMEPDVMCNRGAEKRKPRSPQPGLPTEP